MLVLWCGANASMMQSVIGPIVSRFTVAHKVEPDTTKYPSVGEGDVLLAFGTKALTTLQSMGVLPKNRKVGSLRENPIVFNGVTIFVTYDPSITAIDYARLPEVQWDVALAIRFHNTRSVKPKLGTYEFVESLHEYVEYVDAEYTKTGKPVDCSTDLETKSLDEYAEGAWIISISFSVEEGASKVIYFTKDEKPVEPMPWKDPEDYTYYESLWVQINWLLNTPKISTKGANLKYDCRWIKLHWGMDVDNFKFDTMLVGSLLDENRSNSLKLHAKVMTDMGGYEKGIDNYDMGCMESIPLPEFLEYAGGDTDATLRIARTMKNELVKDRALTNFYVKLLHPSGRVFEKMERAGVLVDVPYYHQLQTEVEAEVARISHAMVACLPNKMKCKYLDQINDSLSKYSSPLKPKLLKEFLFSKAGLNLKPKMFTEKTKEPSTTVEHLMMFKDNPDAANFVKVFQEYGSASKTLSTFIIGFMKHLKSDGRFHPSYMLFRGDYGAGEDDSGTNTGRTSCKDPALQTVPKHTIWTKKLRRVFIAPPGKVILQWDYSQGELRLTAVIANDPTMLAAYAKGVDLHAVTAAQLNGYTFPEFMALPEDVREVLRFGGKAGNFGLIYGMSAGGFREYAASTYGVIMTDEEANDRRNRFFALYSRLTAWHVEAKALAHRQEFVRSPLGRVRHLPLINSRDNKVRAQAERQSINAPTQSCLSDMMQLAMVEIDRAYGNMGIEMCIMTHDSIAAYVPAEDHLVWAKRVKDIMENLPLEKDFGFKSPIIFPVDAEVSLAGEDGVISLAGLSKLKNL